MQCLHGNQLLMGFPLFTLNCSQDFIGQVTILHERNACVEIGLHNAYDDETSF